MSPESRCAPYSVAAHTLYEKARPDILSGPGGDMDLTTTKYEQLSDGMTVRVLGAQFKASRDHSLPYTVKLEAASLKGHRTMFVGGFRDPILIKQVDAFLAGVRKHTAYQNSAAEGNWEPGFHVYGANGIIGELEPGDSSTLPREIWLRHSSSQRASYLLPELPAIMELILDSGGRAVILQWVLVANSTSNWALVRNFVSIISCR